MAWKSVNLNTVIPADVSAAFTTGSGVFQDFLDFARSAIEIVDAFQKTLGPVTPSLTQTAIKALTDALEGFLQLGKAHVLYIPITKTTPSGLDVGGNAKLYNVFASTLEDLFDADRPQYGENDAVALVTLVGGGASYGDAIRVASAFNRVFKPPGNNDLGARTVPTPQNLKAKAVTHPSSKRVAVRLDWDAPKRTYTFPYFPGVSFSVKRYAVIRSKDATILHAHSVLDLFGTRDLREGLVSKDINKTCKVVTVGTGANSSFVDKEDVEPSSAYYYAVAWELSLKERGQTSVVAFDKLSNIAKTRTTTGKDKATAIPPNWHSLPSVFQLIPALADNTFLLTQQLKTVGGTSGGVRPALEKGVRLVLERIERLVHDLDRINVSMENLAASLREPIPTVHGTMFSGVGGNDFLKRELAAALNNKNDPNRPPFDDHEYAVGVCIVVGGPRLPDIQPIVDFLGLLFGTSEGHAVTDVLTAFDGAVTAAEAFVFGEDLQPLSGDVGVGIDPLTGLPVVTPGNVIADDGTPIEGSDAANPNAGETNVTPLRELC